MISERKIAANRRNAQKSCGPRTSAGKASASRNAMRHGLAAMTHRDQKLLANIETLAGSICGDDKRPESFERAVEIAESEALLQLVNCERVAVVERLRDPEAIALTNGDNSLKLAQAKSEDMKQAFKEYNKICVTVSSLTSEQWDAQLDAIEARDSRLQKTENSIATVEERDEFEALYEAAPDLKRLSRYKRRAQSRRKRAIREYLKLRKRDVTVI
jgi:hypothetical protein